MQGCNFGSYFCTAWTNNANVTVARPMYIHNLHKDSEYNHSFYFQLAFNKIHLYWIIKAKYFDTVWPKVEEEDFNEVY